ncbi:MAG: DNA translocase FtsK, partial [Actinobacteria bacterium]|nr:DNA translocase FtsK [Actinomycetota bacterium]
MPATKKKRPLRPRSPSRVKKRTRRRRDGQGHHHPELVGLGLAALGLFLASLLYLDWEGGLVGEKIEQALRDVVGGAAYATPIALTGIGALMLFRSALVQLKPFRTGLGLAVAGLMIALGSEHGGLVGRLLGGGLAKLLGSTGSLLVGSTALVAGGLLLTGASAGALLRSSGIAVRRASTAARRSLERPQVADSDYLPPPRPEPRHKPPVDVVHDYPDVISERLSQHPPLLVDEPDEETQSTLFDLPREEGEYVLPDRSVLKSSPPQGGSTSQANARTAETLLQALAHFGVEATIVGQIAGPRVTRYELQLAPGTKVSKVAALKDDLSYALATTEIRILAPIPGKQAVGVEVPAVSPRIVTLGDIYDDLPATASPLAVWLGKDISGTAVWADLARMPHILIAGTTGSGKSGCINTILTSILLRSTPDEVRLILIDPKRIELNYYESIPHLLTPVVSSPKEASAVLTNVVAEMDRRYERLSLVRARNLPEANRAFRARGEDALPYLLVVIDELADLMMISPQTVEDAIIRLAQKSRAVGIHLVLATQRPSVDVITGMIKANVPSRIAFAVSSQTDSRVILDGSGAESLLGQGDMLFKPLGTSRLQRVQGAYV